MKNIAFLLIMAIGLSNFALSQNSSPEEILAKHYNAVGLENLKKANSIVMTGSITRQDVMPLTITKLRPDKYRIDFSVQDVPAIQSYNGKIAWQTMPWTGNVAPQMVPEARTGDFKNRADFEGPLVNWKEKGFLLDMVGIDTVNDVETYNLKLTRPDGSAEYFFIGTNDYLLHLQRNYRKGRDGSDVEVNVFLSDYREVKGERKSVV